MGWALSHLIQPRNSHCRGGRDSKVRYHREVNICPHIIESVIKNSHGMSTNIDGHYYTLSDRSLLRSRSNRLWGAPSDLFAHWMTIALYPCMGPEPEVV